jgi:hypothetical protein
VPRPQLAPQLRSYFKEATRSTRIGGSAVLEHLAALASNCIDGTSPEQDAVAFTLANIFGAHAQDRDERQVTGADTYLLLGNGLDDLEKAATFVELGGEPGDAIKIIAALARLSPDRLYGRWPPALPDTR